MKRIRGCVVLLGALLAISAQAGTGLFGSQVPVVLTPARLEQPVSEAPASVTIITRQLIRASGARELFEVLRLVPGMSAAKTDGNVPAVAYHGTQARDQRRMLVLIDGRSVYQPGFARVSWNNLPISLNDIERIEVTRGPAAAAYGANAFSGVINIITRDPRDSVGQSARIRLGNNGIRDYRVSGSHQFHRGAWRFSVARQSDDGYDAGLIVGGDSKRIDKFNGRAVWEIGGRDTLTLFAGGSRSRLDRAPSNGLGGMANYTDNPLQRNERAFLQLRWQRRISATHQLQVSAYAQYNNRLTNLDLCFLDPFTGQPGPGGGLFFSRELRDLFLAKDGDIGMTLMAAPATPDTRHRYGILRASGAGPFCGQSSLDIREQRYDLEIQDTLQLAPWARLVAGINLRVDRGESRFFLSGTGENRSRRFFASLAVKPVPPVTVNLGGFWGKDDINGETFSPRTSVNWEFLPGQSLRLVYATAVRTPDIYENRAHINVPIKHLSSGFAGREQQLLGWSPAWLFITRRSPGNLEPERIRSREIGYYGHFASGLQVDVRYFREELWNLISDSLNPFRFQPGNSGYVDNEGVELQAGWRPTGNHLLRLTGAHIHADSNSKTETRFSVKDSTSALWMWTLNRHWFVSSVYYLARSYNGFEFERLDGQVGYRHRLGSTELTWRFVIQHSLSADPMVFRRNRYQDDNRYWLSLAVRFLP